MNSRKNEINLQVNRFARRERHSRIFSRKNLLLLSLNNVLKYTLSPLKKLFTSRFFSNIGKAFSFIVNLVKFLIPVSPQKRLLSQAMVVSFAVVLVSFFVTPAPQDIYAEEFSYSSEYVQSYAIPGDTLVLDDSNYLTKVTPPTEDSSRLGLNDYAIVTVESGQTLSWIASEYGVSVDTLMWENGISDASRLKVGQNILVPPVDGISYVVQSDDSLEDIASKHKIEVSAIVKQNGLEDRELLAGMNLILPGAEPYVDPQSASLVVYNAPPVVSSDGTVYREANVTRDAPRSAENLEPIVADVNAGGFINPTTGILTQGYHAGHYAYDIANRSAPMVGAALGGTVITAKTGYNGGYGNYTDIDHGNGLVTRYAHFEYLNVSVGDWVNQGDILGRMGTTGRSTGIHLHFEVHVNGQKMNPGNYVSY